MPEPEQYEEHPVEPGAVAVGNVMCFRFYGKVDEVRDGGAELILTRCDTGTPLRIQGEDLVAKAASADYSTATKTITRTAMGRLLKAINPHEPVTVHFKKVSGELRTAKCLVTGQNDLDDYVATDLEKPHDANRTISFKGPNVLHVVKGGVKYVART